MTDKTRRRLVVTGMVACLFVAGLAFAVFENTPKSELLASIGIGLEGDAPVVAIDPRYDEADCLFDPEATRELMAAPHATGDSGDMTAGLPANHPRTDATAPSVSGDAGGTGLAGTPGEPMSDADGSSSNGPNESDEDASPTSPHVRETESACPGR
ncbi:MAG: hypothetical protein U1E29_09110 [Coriobacteriia bacterium]|nr:hypothetical protein [Coriobacteriia bacterium]